MRPNVTKIHRDGRWTGFFFFQRSRCLRCGGLTPEDSGGLQENRGRGRLAGLGSTPGQRSPLFVAFRSGRSGRKPRAMRRRRMEGKGKEKENRRTRIPNLSLYIPFSRSSTPSVICRSDPPPCRPITRLGYISSCAMFDWKRMKNIFQTQGEREAGNETTNLHQLSIYFALQ